MPYLCGVVAFRKRLFENKISEETTAKALVSQMDNGETDGT